MEFNGTWLTWQAHGAMAGANNLLHSFLHLTPSPRGCACDHRKQVCAFVLSPNVVLHLITVVLFRPSKAWCSMPKCAVWGVWCYIRDLDKSWETNLAKHLETLSFFSNRLTGPMAPSNLFQALLRNFTKVMFHTSYSTDCIPHKAMCFRFLFEFFVACLLN